MNPTNANSLSLEVLTELLNHYCENPVQKGNVTFDPFTDPLTAERLNTKYVEYTESNHPMYDKHQLEQIDDLLSKEDELLKDGSHNKLYFNTLYKIREKLTTKQFTKKSKEVVKPIKKARNVLANKEYIIQNANTVSLRELSNLLEHYCENPIVEDGIKYEPFTEPLIAEKLNMKYFELTGKNHYMYAKHQLERVSDLIFHQEDLLKEGLYSPEYFNALNKINEKLLKSGKSKNAKNVLANKNYILKNINFVPLDQVAELLDHYCENPIVEDGIKYEPFTEPLIAEKLNIKYVEYTGSNHPMYDIHQLNQINEILSKKRELFLKESYPAAYFDSLEKIKQNILDSLDIDKIFL